jgi:hypothetical protein
MGSNYTVADWQIKDAGGGNITAYNRRLRRSSLELSHSLTQRLKGSPLLSLSP